MRLSTQAYGWLLSTLAVGSLLGALIATRTERILGRARTLGLSLLASSFTLGVPAITNNPVVIGAAFLVGGAGVIISNVVMVSLRQRITPDRLLGRVNACYRMVAWGTMPLGAATGGLLAQLLGLRAVFAITGLLALGVLVGMAVATDDAMDAAERDALTHADPSTLGATTPGSHAGQPQSAGG